MRPKSKRGQEHDQGTRGFEACGPALYFRIAASARWAAFLRRLITHPGLAGALGQTPAEQARACDQPGVRLRDPACRYVFLQSPEMRFMLVPHLREL